MANAELARVDVQPAGLDVPPARFTVHMIANAHIDPAWLWQWKEGREEVLNTCRSALDLMKEFPQLTFSRGAAATYRWIEEDSPAMFDEIRARVAEGRWEIVNGWWEQPDCNLPCGESYVRHSLYAKRYFLDRFGVDVTVGYNVDSFGHCNVLPQVLAKAGFRYYAFFRPGPHEKHLPAHLFWWESPDGSRVLALRAPHHYCCGPDDDMAARIVEACREPDPGVSHVACFYGVGNHGGGPTRNHIRRILAAQATPGMPSIRFSTLQKYFEAVLAEKSDFPVVNDDLQHHAIGCYTAVSEMKRNNREAETLLLDAERISTCAAVLVGGGNHRAMFAAAWQRVLFNQFHDILAGSSIRAVYDDAARDFAAVRRDAGDALDAALDAIGRNLDTRGPGRPLLAWNTLPWERTDLVSADVVLPDFNVPVRLVDAGGSELPVQVCDQVDRAGQCQATLRFVAALPALGGTVLHLLHEPPRAFPGLHARGAVAESDRLKLALDPETGHVVSLFDKARGIECIKAPGCLPVVIRDNSDTWSHDVRAFDDEIGAFAGPASVIECGPVRAVVRACQSWGESTIEQDFIIYSGLDRIDVEMRIDWHERHRMLKLAVPVNVSEPKATFETPYATIQRPGTGNEEPGQRWVDVSGATPRGTGGLLLVNDSKYGYDVKGSMLRLSVLRSPVYAFHDPRVLEPHKRYLYVDQGRQTVRYSLVPHAGRWQDCDAMRRGYALNSPPIATVDRPHAGRLGTAISLARATPDNVLIEVVKQAEEGNAVIVRIYEAAGRDTSATLELPPLGMTHRFSIGHNEIKTFRIEGETVGEVGLLEA